MKRKILIICILLSLTSCEIQYDGETKIVVTGRLIDQNEKPISQKDIEVSIIGGGFISPSSDLISFGKSDQNGDFTLIFPAPKGDNEIIISINDIINQFDEYQSKNIIANKMNFENYKLDLNKITLYKNESVTKLNLILNRTSQNSQLKDIKIEGKQPFNYVDLIPKQNDPSYYYLETNYNVIKNQTIVLKYTVIDYSNSPNTSKQYTISIPIINDAVIYSITY